MDKPVLIIAELGVNHNGGYELARRMIRSAKEAGADVAKFQTFNARLEISRFASKAAYQLETTGADEGQLEMVDKLALPYEAFTGLKRECEEAGIAFASTPFELESVEFLAGLNMPFYKIPSGEITNLPYLIEITKTRKPVLLSTGMSTLSEVGKAVEILKEHGCTDLTLLHCNTQYPTPIEDANVRAMVTLGETFGLPVGYSDHTEGVEAALAAAALGATVIEKHFTLSNDMEGPDHKASMEPGPFAEMVKAIRRLEKALGSGEKKVTASESGNIAIVRKSIVAARDIRKGEALTEENIMAKRPGSGVSPMRWFEVLGQAAKRDFMEDELIEL